jgi:hypothetical protein
MAYKRKEEEEFDGFTLVEDGLPETTDEVYVFGNYFGRIRFGIAKFCPRKGWKSDTTSVDEILSWKEIPKGYSAYLKFIEKRVKNA